MSDETTTPTPEKTKKVSDAKVFLISTLVGCLIAAIWMMVTKLGPDGSTATIEWYHYTPAALGIVTLFGGALLLGVLKVFFWVLLTPVRWVRRRRQESR